MRLNGLFKLSFFLVMLTIVGCGGSSSFKASPILAAASSTGGNPPAATTNGNAAPGTTSTAAPSPTSGSTPTSDSSSTPTSGDNSSSGSSGSSASGNSSNGNPPADTSTANPQPSAAPQVVITSPGEGATVNSPAQIAASVNGSDAIASMQLYVDNGLAFQAPSGQVNTALQMSGGTHTIIAQAWDQSGNVFKSAPLHVNVNAPAPPPPPPPPPPAPSANAAQIQRMPDWSSCAACAGQGGNGPDTGHGMSQGIDSPSLSGASARFDVGGTPWGAALWWRGLGAHDDVQNLQYDLDFYVKSTSSLQALEFDTNQNANGNRYIFGTECDFRTSGTWRVWNTPEGHWVSTGIGCPEPDTGTWHHLTWEFRRSGGQVHFVAVTLDGQRHDVGMTFDAIPQGGSGLDVAFQADLTAAGGDVTVWLDNVDLTWW